MKNPAWPALTLLLAACSYHVEKIPEEPEPIRVQFSLSFAELNSQVLGPKCSRCHGGDWVGNLAETQRLMPDISARIQSTTPGFMMPPQGSTPLSASEKAAVLDWIARGGPAGGGGQPSQPPPEPPAMSFAGVKARVFEPKCFRCHSEDFDTYEKVVSHLEDMEFRVQAIGKDDQMPPADAPQLTDEELNLLLEWIRAGAPQT